MSSLSLHNTFIFIRQWWVGVFALAFVGALLVVGIGDHRAAVIGTAEVDAYFLRADQLLRGESYSDPYRPPLYAVLMALISAASGISTFYAGVVISAAATGAILLLTLRIAQHFLGARGRALVCGLLVLDATVVQHGLLASTDALFCALTLGLLLVALNSVREPQPVGVRRAVALGALLGLAYLTRYTAAACVLVVGYVGVRVASTWRARLRFIGVAFASALLCASPWLAYNTALHGSPFYNENWRNFALAVYGDNDFTYLASTPFTGSADVFFHDPWAVVRLWATNAAAIAWALPTTHSSSPLLALCLPLGVFALWRRAEGALLLVYVLACVLPVAATFSYVPRLLLPVTPVVILVAVIGFMHVITRYQPRALLTIGVLAIVIVLPARKLVSAITFFARYQPVAELDQLDLLVGRTASAQPLRVAATYRFLAYFSQHPERVQQSWVPAYSKQFPQNLLDTVRSERVDYVFVSDLTAARTLQSGLIERSRPACWTIVREESTPTGTVRVYRNDCAPP